MNHEVHASLGNRDVEFAFPESPFVVMKFGGRSVATARNWTTIANLVQERLAEGLVPIVVHSALAGVSNTLEALLQNAMVCDTDKVIADIKQRHVLLADELGVNSNLLDSEFQNLQKLIDGLRLVGEINLPVYARVMATGELAATTLGCGYLESIGLRASWRDARQILHSNNEQEQNERTRFLAASCDFAPQVELQSELLHSEEFIVTQGFIAGNTAGDTVLLGRGGSDTSAAYLAACLQAQRLEIWTDVPGFFSTDPKIVRSARLLRSLHYREAQEIASAGGAILHPRSIAPVRQLGIPLFLRWTSHPDCEGTLISIKEEDDKAQLKAISQRSGLTLVSMESIEMWHQVGFLADVFEIFRSHGFSVDLISTSESNVTVSIDLQANVTDQQAINALVQDLGGLCRATIIEDCAAVTLVGNRIRAILHELSSVMEVFEEQKVHLVTQAADVLNFTFVVDSEHAHRLVKRIHGLLVNRFQEGGVFGPTWEELSGSGSGLIGDRSDHPVPWWETKKDELVKIAEEHESAYVYDIETTRGALARLNELSAVDSVYYAMKANAHPDILRVVYEQNVNFECVSPGEIERVLEVIPNIDRKRILFTPNFASRKEYEWAFEQDIWVTLDNLYPLKNWATVFSGREIFIRIDTGQGRGHHEHVRTAGAHSKFGVPLFELEELRDLINLADATVVGLHAHTGSGVLTPDNWRQTGEHLNGLRAFFPNVRYMDLGGGIGIPERLGQKPMDMASLDESLRGLKKMSGSVELWLEPGRFVVGPAGVLVTRVTQLKGKDGEYYVGVSTGMNSLIRPALYGAYHEIFNLSRLDAPVDKLMTIVGPVCETGDRLGSDRLLPVTEEGDVMLIANAGAYGYAMSSRYNLREPAVEVVL